MLPGFRNGFGLLEDFSVQAAIFFVLILIAGRLYETILE